MRSTPEIDRRLRERLIEAVDKECGGNADAFGRKLGYTNGGYIREIIRNVKPVRESLIDRVHGLPGYEGWFSDLLPAVVAGDLAEKLAAIRAADESYYVDRFSAAARSLARQFDSVPDGEGKIRLLAKLEGLIRVASKPRTPSVQSATVEPPPPSGEARGKSRAGT